MEQYRFVDQIGSDKRGCDRWPTLHHQPRDAAPGEQFQHGCEIEATAARWGSQNFDPGGPQGLFGSI